MVRCDDVVEPKYDFHYGVPLDIESIQTKENLLTPGERAVFSTVIYNNTGQNIQVADRSGVPISIPPSGHKTNDVVIYKTYDITQRCRIDPRLLFKEREIYDLEVKAYERSIDFVLQGDKFSGRQIRVAYRIQKNDLSYGGLDTCYVQELDLVISVGDNALSDLHPFCRKASRDIIIEHTYNARKRAGATFSIKIVSNDGKIDPRYINIAGTVYKIIPETDNSLHNGVYICTTSPMDDSSDRVFFEKHIQLEEAEKKYRLFNTYERALNLGDEFAAKEYELKEQQLKFKKQEHDRELERLELKRELEAKKHELAIITEYRRNERDLVEHERTMQMYRERDITEQNAARRKEYYEDKSYRRKDFLEFLKYIPAILTTVTGALMAWFKFKEMSEG